MSAGAQATALAVPGCLPCATRRSCALLAEAETGRLARVMSRTDPTSRRMAALKARLARSREDARESLARLEAHLETAHAEEPAQ